MDNVRYCFYFAVFIRAVCCSITVFRGDADEIQNLSRDACDSVGGEYTTAGGRCRCPSASPTFMSDENTTARCVGNSYLGCTRWPSGYSRIPTDCLNETTTNILVWDTRGDDETPVVGTWVAMTTNVWNFVSVRHESGSGTARVSLSDLGRWTWQGHLFIVKPRCARSCYFVKIDGILSYPLPLVTSPTAVAHEKKREMKAGVIVLLVVTGIFLVVFLYVGLVVCSHRVLRSAPRKPEIVVMEEIYVTPTTLPSPVYENPRDAVPTTELEPEYQTVELTNGDDYTDSREMVYYSTAGVSDSGSDYTPLDQFNYSHYSAISPSYSESSIKRGMHNSSWEQTPGNRLPRNPERDPEYEELLGASFQNSPRPVTQSAGTGSAPEILYFEVDVE